MPRIYVWSELQEWYKEAGILEIDDSPKVKMVWNELPGRDTPVKAINQLFARFSELFPKLEKARHTEAQLDGRTMGDAYYLGICKQISEKGEKPSPESPECRSVVTASPEHPQKVTFSGDASGDASGATILTQSATGDSGDDFSPFSEICNLLSKLTDDERQKLAEILTQPQPQPEQPTPSTQPDRVTIKKGLRVRYVGDNANCVTQYGKLDLVVDEVDKYGEVACLKPDGSFTTWLHSQDLRVIPD